jgi:hypothetical protein
MAQFIEMLQNFEDCIWNFEVSFIMIWNIILKSVSGGQRSDIKNFVTSSSEWRSPGLHYIVFSSSVYVNASKEFFV